jgi:DNA-directed RNA polymerase specialized sigma54-like protein
MYEKRLAKENRTNRRRIAKYRKRMRIKEALSS